MLKFLESLWKKRIKEENKGMIEVFRHEGDTNRWYFASGERVPLQIWVHQFGTGGKERFYIEKIK